MGGADNLISPDRQRDPEAIYAALRTSEILAGGGALLLAGGLSLSLAASPFLRLAGAYATLLSIGLGFFFILVTGLAVVCFIFGMHLLADLARERLVLQAFLAASIVGPPVGLIIATWPLSESIVGVIFVWLFLPYVPWIFGPVVMAHGFIFALRPGLRLPGAGHLPFASGCVFLVTLPVVAMSAAGAGLGGPSGNLLVSLFAGSTSLGYFLVRLGLGIEYEEVREPLSPDWFRVGRRAPRSASGSPARAAAESNPLGPFWDRRAR